MPLSVTFMIRLGLLSLTVPATLAIPRLNIDAHDLSQDTPHGVVKRAPIRAVFDTTGWEDIAEENCYDMLCKYGGNRIYTRNLATDSARGKYSDSGASKTPFQGTETDSRMTDQINPDTISAEEFPWRSTKEGGTGAILQPATTDEQRVQGGRIIAGYNGNKETTPEVGWGDEFEINFIGPGAYKIYCKALFSNPPDTSICRKGKTQTMFGTTNVNLENYVYQQDQNQVPNAFFHVGGSMAGKFGHISKRELPQEDTKVPLLQKRSVPEWFEDEPIESDDWQGH